LPLPPPCEVSVQLSRVSYVSPGRSSSTPSGGSQRRLQASAVYIHPPILPRGCVRMIRYAAMGHQGAVLAHNRVDRSGVYKRALSTSTRPSYLQDSSDGSHSGRGKPAEMARSSSSGGTEAAQHTETHPNMACKRTASRFYTRQVPNMACKRNASRLHGGDQHVHVHAHAHMHVHGLDGITASATQGRAAPVSRRADAASRDQRPPPCTA
jgi:hypothetical protein